MEHFLPLAIASLVISLISIILLDYFGPTPSSPSDKNALPPSTNDLFDNKEEYTEKVLSEEPNKEMTLEQEEPFSSKETIQQTIEDYPFKQLSFLLQFKLRLGQI